ncbi:PilW family protein [Aquicella siphonis]|nr:hypothetical protein [Aquicella siphonis]
MLVEIMIGITVSLYVFSLLVSAYLACWRSQHIQSALQDIQANAFTIAQILKSEINKAGRVGCAHLSGDFPVRSFQGFNLTPATRLTGNSAQEFTVRYAGYPSARLLAPMSDDNRLMADAGVSLASGDMAIISNCRHAEIFRVDRVIRVQGRQIIVSTLPLHDRYEKHSEISRLEINRYSVRQTGRNERDGKPVSALFLEDINHRHFELSTGINGMRIRYTVSQSGHTADLPAHEVTDWSQVTGVGFALELASSAISKTWYVYAYLQ